MACNSNKLECAQTHAGKLTGEWKKEKESQTLPLAPRRPPSGLAAERIALNCDKRVGGIPMPSSHSVSQSAADDDDDDESFIVVVKFFSENM